jgi:hypothetical protein
MSALKLVEARDSACWIDTVDNGKSKYAYDEQKENPDYDIFLGGHGAPIVPVALASRSSSFLSACYNQRSRKRMYL